MIVDLFGTEDRFNVPGSLCDDNWTQRLSLPIEKLARRIQFTP